MFSRSVPSSVADLLSLALRGVEVMSRVYILEVLLGASESTFSSNNTRLCELESQLASRNSEFDAAGVELSLTERFLRFVQDVASLMCKEVQSQGQQHHKVEAVGAAAEVSRTAAESKVQCLTASESALRGEVEQLTQRVEKLSEKVSRMRQDCDLKVEDVLSECDDLQVRLNATAPQLWVVFSSLTMGREQLEQHFGR